MMGSNAVRQELFRSGISTFIQERREAKLKGNEEEDAAAASKYEYATWLDDAARRVGQIQAVTHVAKATHPYARGSSLHVEPSKLPQRKEVGSHALGADYAEDVVGNAAALDVFKFLKIEVDGARLLDWMRKGDPDLRAALHSDAAVASRWMTAFGSMIRSDQQAASHSVAKQVYWLTGDDASDDAQFHLLQPLFSSSLAHAVHTEIQEARFGEENKMARQAYFKREAHETPYRDYRNLAVRKLGGTKPQNISQLNSERGGVNYLLASLPPAWAGDRPQSLLHRTSAIEIFGRTREARGLIKELASFLLSNPSPTLETRSHREQLEQELGLQIAVFGANVSARMEPGWTRQVECQLQEDEKLWLDPERVDLPVREGHEQEDAEFNAAYTFGDWADNVAGRFANWVNAQLHAAGLITIGEAEYKHWARQALIDAAGLAPKQRRAPMGGVS